MKFNLIPKGKNLMKLKTVQKKSTPKQKTGNVCLCLGVEGVMFGRIIAKDKNQYLINIPPLKNLKLINKANIIELPKQAEQHWLS